MDIDKSCEEDGDELRMSKAFNCSQGSQYKYSSKFSIGTKKPLPIITRRIPEFIDCGSFPKRQVFKRKMPEDPYNEINKRGKKGDIEEGAKHPNLYLEANNSELPCELRSIESTTIGPGSSNALNENCSNIEETAKRDLFLKESLVRVNKVIRKTDEKKNGGENQDKKERNEKPGSKTEEKNYGLKEVSFSADETIGDEQEPIDKMDELAQNYKIRNNVGQDEGSSGIEGRKEAERTRERGILAEDMEMPIILNDGILEMKEEPIANMSCTFQEENIDQNSEILVISDDESLTVEQKQLEATDITVQEMDSDSIQTARRQNVRKRSILRKYLLSLKETSTEKYEIVIIKGEPVENTPSNIHDENIEQNLEILVSSDDETTTEYNLSAEYLEAPRVEKTRLESHENNFETVVISDDETTTVKQEKLEDIDMILQEKESVDVNKSLKTFCIPIGRREAVKQESSAGIDIMSQKGNLDQSDISLVSVENNNSLETDDTLTCEGNTVKQEPVEENLLQLHYADNRLSNTLEISTKVDKEVKHEPFDKAKLNNYSNNRNENPQCEGIGSVRFETNNSLETHSSRNETITVKQEVEEMDLITDHNVLLLHNSRDDDDILGRSSNTLQISTESHKKVKQEPLDEAKLATFSNEGNENPQIEGVTVKEEILEAENTSQITTEEMESVIQQNEALILKMADDLDADYMSNGRKEEVEVFTRCCTSSIQKFRSLRPNLCSICELNVPFNEREEHYITAHKEGAFYLCPICDYWDSGVRALASHLEAKHRSYFKEKCLHCDETFTSWLQLSLHKSESHPDQMVTTCSYCEFQGQTYMIFLHHILESHDGRGLKLTCKDCKFVTLSPMLLEDHVTGKHTFRHCSQCDFATLDMSAMNHHNKTAHKSKRTATPRKVKKQNVRFCPHCNFQTKKRSSMTSHIECKHKGQFTVECDFCKFECVDSIHLKEHYLREHDPNSVDFIDNSSSVTPVMSEMDSKKT